MLRYTHNSTNARVHAVCWLGGDPEQFLAANDLWAWSWDGDVLIGPSLQRCYPGEMIVRTAVGGYRVVDQDTFRARYSLLRNRGSGLPKILKKIFEKLFSRP